MSGQTVLIDFDATLHPYTAGWIGDVPEPEEPIEGAREFLYWLNAQGFKTVVFTTRAKTEVGLRGVWDWLEFHDLVHLVEDVTDRKVPGIALVDDRAVPYLGEWQSVMERVLELAKGRSHGAPSA